MCNCALGVSALTYVQRVVGGLVHARLGPPLGVVERQQIADIGVRWPLRQLGQTCSIQAYGSTPQARHVSIRL